MIIIIDMSERRKPLGNIPLREFFGDGEETLVKMVSYEDGSMDDYVAIRLQHINIHNVIGPSFLEKAHSYGTFKLLFCFKSYLFLLNRRRDA